MCTTEPSTDRGRVLLVEDHSDVAKATIHMLHALGCEVMLAGTVASALAAAAAERFCLVLIDYHLPDGTGVDLLASLWKHGPIRAILITAHTRNLVLHGDQARFVQYLAKPVELEELRSALDSAMRTAV
jgi:two-component system aerobic respiration control sensor histidine kinase ArcB